MRYESEPREPWLAYADTTQVIQERQLAVLEYRTRIDLPFADIERYDLGGSLFLINDVKRSSGTGRNVVVLCSLEISRMVCRKRSCNAIGSLLIVAAACTIFSAA